MFSYTTHKKGKAWISTSKGHGEGKDFYQNCFVHLSIALTYILHKLGEKIKQSYLKHVKF
jgi:L-rhamnose isomerase